MPVEEGREGLTRARRRLNQRVLAGGDRGPAQGLGRGRRRESLLEPGASFRAENGERVHPPGYLRRASSVSVGRRDVLRRRVVLRELQLRCDLSVPHGRRRQGGRSTHGICFGALAWLVEEGRVGDIDVSGLAVVLVVRYDDDEPGSPWTIVLHVDAAGDDGQRAALADVFLGRLGGPKVGALPWVRKTRHLVEVRTGRDRARAGR